jgi:hypothetical protein
MITAANGYTRSSGTSEHMDIPEHDTATSEQSQNMSQNWQINVIVSLAVGPRSMVSKIHNVAHFSNRSLRSQIFISSRLYLECLSNLVSRRRAAALCR